jgi:hypothetical protein
LFLILLIAPQSLVRRRRIGLRSPCFALVYVGRRRINQHPQWQKRYGDFAEKQSGAGSPHSKVRPKRLTRFKSRKPVNLLYS